MGKMHVGQVNNSKETPQNPVIIEQIVPQIEQVVVYEQQRDYSQEFMKINSDLLSIEDRIEMLTKNSKDESFKKELAKLDKKLVDGLAELEVKIAKLEDIKCDISNTENKIKQLEDKQLDVQYRVQEINSTPRNVSQIVTKEYILDKRLIYTMLVLFGINFILNFIV